MNVSTRPGWLALVLTAFGASVVGFALVTTHTVHRPAWALIVGLVSVVLWVSRSVLEFAGARRSGLCCIVVAALAGAAVAGWTDGLTVVPAAVGVLVVLGDVAVPARRGLALAAAALLLTAIGAVPAQLAVPALLAMMGGLVLAVFAGLSRRQFRRAEQQAALLRERDLQMREEASRVAIARDLHDVLAHSLGGLVIQLDAVDALLESGDGAAAHARVLDARRLAGEGLAEARRAVAALRDPDAAAGSRVSAAELEAALRDLADAHRALGGVVELSVDGTGTPVSGEQASAVQRALQEALSNARKHAPGEPVAAELAWQNGRVRLTVSNPIAGSPSALAASGGGHGLDGMRERFSALPHGGSATAGRQGGRFTVEVEARLA